MDSCFSQLYKSESEHVIGVRTRLLRDHRPTR